MQEREKKISFFFGNFSIYRFLSVHSRFNLIKYRGYFWAKEGSGLLYESLLRLETVEECRRFLQDLCTVSELKAMEQRIEVAMYLREGMIYQDILKRTGASSATISRVNRCLQYGDEGYPAQGRGRMEGAEGP